MSKVTDILYEKGSQVLSIGREASALDAALLMNDHKIGALVVIDNGQVVGMFTERDVLRRIVADRLDPATTYVDEVMTRDVICATSEMTIEEARQVMRSRRIRHLPVVTEDRSLLGLISIGDLNAWELDGQERTIFSLKEYIYGRT